MTVTKEKINIPESFRPLLAEFALFLHELPRLLAEGHENRRIVIKGAEILGIWDTHEEAYEAAAERFGFNGPFLNQMIDRRFLDYEWPDEVVQRKAI